MGRSVYVLRIKPGLQDMVPEALEQNQLIIGWTDVPTLLDPSLTREDFRAELSREYYPTAKTLNRAGSAAGNMWRFLREMQAGDVVLVPHRKSFYVAEVTGSPFHDRSVSEGGFRRPARWLNDKQPFFRRDQPGVYEALLERKTCYMVDITFRPNVARFVGELFSEVELAKDVAELVGRTDLPPTTRDALVKARVGQGKFREDLLAAWDGACAVTGCQELKAIRASHAKRWCDSTDLERLDSNNGLPLVGNLDALFDAGLIAFSEDGSMIVSEKIKASDRSILGIPNRLRQELNPSQARYLREHRERHFPHVWLRSLEREV